MAVVSTKLDTKCAEFWEKLTNSTGTLSFDQFYDAIQKHGVEISRKSLLTQWTILDTDHSDSMDLLEFKALIKKHFESSDDKRILQQAFNEMYSKFFPDDINDLLFYKTDTPRIAHKNVKVVIRKSTLKQSKEFQVALDKKLGDIFRLIDEDNNGTLELNEMWQAVKLLEIPISYQDLETTFQFFDTDKNGHIEEAEFKRWMKSQVTKYWSENPENNQFVALQRAVLSADTETILSTRDSKKTFRFDEDEEVDEKQKGNENAQETQGKKHEAAKEEVVDPKYAKFVACTLEEVESWDMNAVGDFIEYLFRDKAYDSCRDKYVAIFMNLNVDGKTFMELKRYQVSAMGIVTKKGERHVSVIMNAQRHIRARSSK
mmetsp:Transcript_11961/g.19243  ORF Transcript_11961/g.19243 Transcript_11961/m.19243 type:complete len:373 (-) Transcript_11961:117-1235(-)